jgi:hypothetical protein
MKMQKEGGSPASSRSARVRRLMDALGSADIGAAKQEVVEGLEEELPGTTGKVASAAADVLLPDSAADLATDIFPPAAMTKRVLKGGKLAAKAMKAVPGPKVMKKGGQTSKEFRTKLIEERKAIMDVPTAKRSDLQKKRMQEIEEALTGDTFKY